MDIYIIGKIIKEFRERKNISQEELAFDLCATSTLSRIESGKQSPNKKLVEAFFSKMGLSSPSTEIPMSKAEIRRWNIEHEIRSMINNANYEYKDLLDEYERLGEMSILEKQTFILLKTIFEVYHNEDEKIALKHFIEALKLTFSKFDTNSEIPDRLYTKTELLLIDNIAVSEYELGNSQNAIEKMEFLYKYHTTKFVTEEELSKNLPTIIFNLSNWKGLAGLYEESLKFSEEGIKICTKYNKLSHFFRFIFNRGYCFGKLGDVKNSKKYLELAFDIMKEMNNTQEIEELIPQVNQEFGFNFEI